MLPGVRLACDGYVQFVREASLLEAVASSLTELFAPSLMARRLEAWKQHYPWVSSESLEYFQLRISAPVSIRSRPLNSWFSTPSRYDMQERCVDALVKKADILWHLLDYLSMTYVETGSERKTRAAYMTRQQSQTSA